MSDKKNIDRLFQEKFKNFEVTPDDAVWKKIQARKNKDRKRVILIPFWYRVAGVAALITVIMSIGSLVLTDTTKTDAIVVTEDQKNNNTAPVENKKENTSTKRLVDTQESTFNDAASQNTNTNNEAITNNLNQREDQKNNSFEINGIETSSGSNKDAFITQNSTNKKEFKETSIAGKNVFMVTSKDKKKDQIHFEEQTKIANNTSDVKNKKTSVFDPRKTSEDPISQIQNTTGISENNTSVNKTSENISEITSPYLEGPAKNKNSAKNGIADALKDSGSKTPDEVSEQGIDQDPKDGKKSIFDAIKEKEEKETAVAETDKIKRWNISPNVAPVYYDSFGGSSIDPQFSDNNKQGEVNLSYGIQVAYAINKRLIVRSGVSKVDVGYNTEDVGFGISSVSRGENGFTNTQSIIVSDYRGETAIFAPAPMDINDEILVKSQNPGLLNHSIGYIEVPLELKYSLTDSKLGVHMIGGVSTLFLEDEEVSIIAGNFRNQNVAREETVNDISFSGNIGIGFDYKLSDQFQINMEPIFKYQFNGFRDNAQDFKPYYFGVYTGISFKF